MTPDDTRDRVIRLEAEVEHISAQLTEMSTKVSAMHDVLMQAKGAKWVVVVAAAIVGGITSWIASVFNFFGVHR